jgi:TonB family protein
MPTVAAIALVLMASVRDAPLIDAVLDAMYPSQVVLIAGDVWPARHAAGVLSNDRFDDALLDPSALGDSPAALRFAAPSMTRGTAAVRYEVMKQTEDGVEKGHGLVTLRRANGAWRVASQTYEPDVRPPHDEVPIRVGGGVKAPVAIRKFEPPYTEVARRNRVAGIVIVEGIIRRTGRLTDVRVLKGLPDGLDESAVNTLKQWRFRPASLNGIPVSVYYNLTVNFRLEEKKLPDAANERQH